MLWSSDRIRDSVKLPPRDKENSFGLPEINTWVKK